jgi:hypothetical protein
LLQLLSLTTGVWMPAASMDGSWFMGPPSEEPDGDEDGVDASGCTQQAWIGPTYVLWYLHC